jgi:uncharacterized damage-inducible protein DinB
MNLAQVFAAELQRESINTRKLLERVPEDKFDWQPHAKSMKLLKLATHIAEIPGMFATGAVKTNELDFARSTYKRPEVKTTEELLQFFDNTLATALEALSETPAEEMDNNWAMRNGETEIFTLPKKAVIRTICLNHLYHHRGQLSVYLRLLDVPVPGVYGPTADEMVFG